MIVQLATGYLDKSTDPNKAWSADAAKMRERARGLFGSAGYGRRCATAVVDNMIGEMIQTQITVDWFPTWTPKNEDEIQKKKEVNLELNRQQEEQKKMWNEVADITGALEWGDMQRLTAQTTAIDGEDT